MKEKTDIVPKQMVYLLFVCVALLALFAYLPQPSLPPFISAEVHFYDPSTQGLKIMPASCASNPAWAHGVALNGLVATGDGYGFKSPPSTTEYNAYTNAGVYICVTNTTGSYVFVPAKSAAELNSFRSYPPAGVTVW